MLNDALIFAVKAHGNQIRKYTFEPYYFHPLNVMLILSTITDDEDVLKAALLHDVVEDTPVTIDKITNKFGFRVGKIVNEVTDISRTFHGNRKTRKAMDRWHISYASPEGQTVKLADLIDNTRSIVEHDPDFAKVYMKEKKLLLNLLTKGNKVLYNIASKTVEDYFNELEFRRYQEHLKKLYKYNKG